MNRWVIADPVRFVTLCMATAPALTAIPALIYSAAAAALNWSKWPEAAPPAVEWAGRLLETGAGALIFLPLAVPSRWLPGSFPVSSPAS